MGTDRWERRERKLLGRRRAMKASGMGLKKVLLPLLEKRAKEREKERERATQKKHRPQRHLWGFQLSCLKALSSAQPYTAGF